MPSFSDQADTAYLSDIETVVRRETTYIDLKDGDDHFDLNAIPTNYDVYYTYAYGGLGNDTLH